MSPPETKLWNVLRVRPDGLQFRRQYPCGPFDLDFFCRAAALAIEIDGEAQNMGDNPDRDRRRDQLLRREEISTLRIAAGDVRENLDGVVRHILERCALRTPPPLSERSPSPRNRGEDVQA